MSLYVSDFSFPLLHCLCHLMFMLFSSLSMADSRLCPPPQSQGLEVPLFIYLCAYFKPTGFFSYLSSDLMSRLVRFLSSARLNMETSSFSNSTSLSLQIYFKKHLFASSSSYHPHLVITLLSFLQVFPEQVHSPKTVLIKYLLYNTNLILAS